MSDQERIEAYRECEAYFDRHHNINHKPAILLFTDPEVSDFRCTYAIDDNLRHLAATDKNKISLRCYSANSGCNERQYGSAKINLPVVQATRTQYACYSGYHNSSDNQEFFSLDSIIDSALQIFEFAKYYEIYKLRPTMSLPCEPQLGRRGLYPSVNTPKVNSISNDSYDVLSLMMNVLNLASGKYTTDELSHMLDVSPLYLSSVLEKLKYKGVIQLPE